MFFQAFLTFSFYFLCVSGILDNKHQLTKVAPVLWKETKHHIQSQDVSQDTLIVAYLRNPCHVISKNDDNSNCKQYYNQLIKNVSIESCEENLEFKQLDDINIAKTNLKSRKRRFLGLVEDVIIVGSLLFGIEAFQTTKKMTKQFETTVEHIKSIQADIIETQRKSNELLQKTIGELKSFKMATKMKEQMLVTHTTMDRLFQRATNGEDFSLEFNSLFAGLEICDKHYFCPVKLAKFKGSDEQLLLSTLVTFIVFIFYQSFIHYRSSCLQSKNKCKK
ncbi:hypothetical protein BLOT_009340 [Blomia tropicalis]|nr:hypothetical protein BLOT_009340 [Blomia tropicalis]